MKKNLSNKQGIFYSIFQSNKLKNSDIDSILNYTNDRDSGKSRIQSFKDNLSGCSVAAQKYIKDAEKANKTTKEISEGLKGASIAGGKFKNVIANVGTTLLNSLVGAGIGLAINAIISGIANLVNSAANAYKDGIEKAKTLKDELVSLDDETGSINKQLEETQAKLKELEKIKSPNLFEQEQIDGLKQTNDELERQIKLLEYEKENKLREADKAARETAYRSLLGMAGGSIYSEADNVWEQIGVSLSSSLTQAFSWLQGNTASQQTEYLKDFERKTLELADLQQQLDNAIKDNAEKSTIDSLQNRITEYETEISNMRGIIQERVSDANIQLNALDPNNQKNTEFIKWYEQYIENANKLLNGAEKETFSDVFESIDFKDTTDKLKELYRQGKLTEETFANVEGIDKFIEALKEVCGEGASVETIIGSIISYMSNLGNSADDTAGSIETVADSLSKIIDSASDIIDNTQTIQNAINKLEGGENLSYDEVTKLLELDPSLADSFTRTAQGYKVAIDTLLEARSKYINANKGTVESQLETAKSDVKNYEDEIQRLEKQKAQYEADLQNIQEARTLREKFGYDSLSDEMKAQFIDNITQDTNSSYYVDLITDEELAAEKAKEIEDLIKQTETDIDLANGNLKDSVDLVSSLKLIFDQVANPFDDQSKLLSDIIEKWSDLSDLLNKTTTEIEENGSISLDTLKEISSAYPQLENDVSNYLMGLTDEKALLAKLNKAYEDSLYEDRYSVAQKIKLTDEELQNYLNVLNTKYAEDEKYYANLGALGENFVNYMKDNYDVDLQNCKTWNDAKLKMQQETMAKLTALAGGVNIEDYYDFNTGKKIGNWSELYTNAGLVGSGVLSELSSILSDYGDGIQEFGKLFKSANTLDGISSKTSTNSSSTSSSSKDSSSSFFDWVQVRLEKLKTITSNFIDSITETISKKQSEVYLNKAVKAVRNEKVANQKAIQTYTAAANKIGLSSTWQKKVQNGSYSLDDIKNSDLAEKIQKYQEFWDKIEDCKQNIKDLIQQEQELIIQTEDLNLDDYEYKANRKSYAVGVAEGKITTKDLQGKRVTTKDYETVNKALTAENTAIKSQIRYASMIQSKYDPTSDRYRELQEIIESGKQTLQDNTDAILENNKKIADLKIADYSNQAHMYNRKVELGQTRISLAQAEGKKIKSSSYQYLIDNTGKENEALRQQRAYIQRLQAETEEGSELWSEYQSQLEEINDTIYSNRIQQAEWNAEMRNIPMEQLKSTLEMTDAYLETFKSYASMMEYVHGKSSITVDMINNQKWSDEAFKKQVELYQKYYNEYLSAMDEGRTADAENYFKLYSDEYQAYTDMLTTNEELNRQARDITLYRNYEKDLEHIEDVKKAISSLEGILNDDALFNDDGSFSKQGIAKIALTINQLEQARASVENYQKQIDVLNANRNQYKSEDEFNEKLRELTEGYQNATAEVNQYTEAIKDLYKNQAQEELNVLNELIDARSEALSKKKE